MIEALLSGIFFGFGNGVSPGPLMALSISTTLKKGIKDGIYVSISPLISDLLIISVSYYIASQALSYDSLLSIITILGSLFLLFLGWKCLTFKRSDGRNLQMGEVQPSFSLLKGVLTNILNPYPYIFWITVGIPFCIKIYGENSLPGLMLYFISFYFSFCITKTVVVITAFRGQISLSTKSYEIVMKILGLCFWISSFGYINYVFKVF